MDPPRPNLNRIRARDGRGESGVIPLMVLLALIPHLRYSEMSVAWVKTSLKSELGEKD